MRLQSCFLLPPLRYPPSQARSCLPAGAAAPIALKPRSMHAASWLEASLGSARRPSPDPRRTRPRSLPTPPRATARPFPVLPRGRAGGTPSRAPRARGPRGPPRRRRGQPIMLALTQISNYLTVKGSFLAVSKPNFASKYALESSRRDLQNALLCTVLVGSVWVKKYTKINT